jgi:hypothetical protein
MQSLLVEDAVEQVTGPPSAGQVDDRLVDHLAGVQVRQPGQPVADGAQQHDRAAEHPLEAECGTRAGGPWGDGEVDLPLGQEAHHVRGAGGDDLHVHPGVLVLESSDCLPDVDARWHGHGGDAHRPAEQPPDLRDGVASTLDLREGGSGRLEERPAGVGQLGAAPAAGEQVRPQLAFQRQQRCREARLHHVQLCRGAGERAFPDDGQEVLELPQLHDGRRRRAASGRPCGVVARRRGSRHIAGTARSVRAASTGRLAFTGRPWTSDRLRGMGAVSRPAGRGVRSPEQADELLLRLHPELAEHR